jgi:hypothetical protein
MRQRSKLAGARIPLSKLPYTHERRNRSTRGGIAIWVSPAWAGELRIHSGSKGTHPRWPPLCLTAIVRERKANTYADDACGEACAYNGQS